MMSRMNIILALLLACTVSHVHSIKPTSHVRRTQRPIRVSQPSDAAPTSRGPVKGASPPFGETGYLLANQTYDTNLFYWYVEAETNASTAPLILYLQGGPGCSMAMGLLYELGPYYVQPNLTLTPNKNGWNTKYNVLFIDNPVGTGFSYTNNPDGMANSEAEATADLYNALVQFFTAKPELQSREFYIFGESYAGKWVPEIAYYALMQEKAGQQVPFNLIGFGVGDGLSDPVIQAQSHATFAYSTGLIDDVQRGTIETMQTEVADLVAKGDFTKAGAVWGNITLQIMLWSGMPDPSDMRYWGFGRLNFQPGIEWLNQPSIRADIGVGNHTYTQACSQDVASRLAGDQMRSVKPMFTDLLDRYRVILYNGNFDFTVTPNGVNDWITTIPWSGAQAFNSAQRWVWSVDKQVAGFVRSASALTHVVVIQAGHMVPEDQPARTLALVDAWITKTLNPPPPPPPPPMPRIEDL